MHSNEVQILLVEDDDIDAEAVYRALRKCNITNPITRAEDGIEALQLLRGEDRVAITRPTVILLDLNMPRMGGLEFLHELRSDESLADSIVFVLTTSNSDRDKAEAYRANVAGYILKSKAGNNYTQLIELLQSYWQTTELPL